MTVRGLAAGASNRGLPASLGQTIRTIRRAAGLRGFAVHALTFGTAFCLAVLTGAEREYFWPFVGWTLGLAMHGLAAIGPGQFLAASWEEESLRRALGAPPRG